jgi:hypothetical protein
MLLAIRAFPGGLASHAAGGVRQRREAFVPDLATTILTNAKSTLGPPVARVVGLLAIPLENLADGLAVRPLAQNLREVGLPEPLAHEDSVSTCTAFKTLQATSRWGLKSAGVCACGFGSYVKRPRAGTRGKFGDA